MYSHNTIAAGVCNVLLYKEAKYGKKAQRERERERERETEVQTQLHTVNWEPIKSIIIRFIGNIKGH